MTELLRDLFDTLTSAWNRLRDWLRPDYGVDDHPRSHWYWDPFRRRWVYRHRKGYNCAEYVRARIEGPGHPAEFGKLGLVQFGCPPEAITDLLERDEYGFEGPLTGNRCGCGPDPATGTPRQSACVVVYQTFTDGDRNDDANWQNSHVAILHPEHCDWAAKRSGFYPIEHFQTADGYLRSEAQPDKWRMRFYCRDAPFPDYSDQDLHRDAEDRSAQ